MRKIRYEIQINHGETARTPFVYSYGSTKDIALHLHQGSARISFSQGTGRAQPPLLSGHHKLCVDAIKKAMLLHLLIYGKPLRISNAVLCSGDTVCETYSNRNGDPLVFSMIENKLDHPLPKEWKQVCPLILQTPKSAYDGRMNAVVALLLAKAQYFRSEKSLYLWMAMNGLYNYLTSECKKLSGHKNEYRKEHKQHEFLCKIIGQDYSTDEISDKVKNALFQKGLALLKRTTLPLDVAYASLQQEDSELYRSINELILTGGKDGAPLRMTPYTFMIVWLPYQIRCNYFHTNQAMPLLMYADEPLLIALNYTNYFLEQFLEEQLPQWLQGKELNEQQKTLLSKADKQV